MDHPPEDAAVPAAKPMPTRSRPGSFILRSGGLAGGAIVSAWLLSALYHVIVFLVMYSVPWLSGIVGARIDSPPPFTAILGDIDQPTVTLAPSAQLEMEVTPTEVDPLRFQPREFQPVLEVAPKRSPGLSILGIGTGGGELDKYGFSVSPGGQGPSFFGLGGQARGARRIVYVVDRSGSMMTTLEGVKKELRQSIGRLRRSQKFHVIFFNAGAPLENPPRRLVSAIQAHKRDTFRFLEDITAGGGTDPRVAIRRAFAAGPDLIYLLTDGEFDARLIDVLDKLNHSRKVRIFTIAYVSRPGAALLERIAREHNGEYRFVSDDEIF